MNADPSKLAALSLNNPALELTQYTPTVSSLFFDLVPREVLGHVLRFCSSHPKSKQWAPHIPLESIVGLYGITGAFGMFMETRFDTLCVSKSFRLDQEKQDYNWKERKGHMLWTENIEVARRFVLAGGGKSLRTSIFGGLAFECNNVPEIAEDFFNNCPNLKSLSVDSDADVWVSRFGGQLEELEAVTETPSYLLGLCHNLRELNLFVVGFEQIWKWEEIGRKLESLTLDFICSEEKKIEKIKIHCRNLRQIRFYKMHYRNRKISDLLASYGNQLQYCHVEGMNESELTTITGACKNVRFSANIYEHNKLYPTLKVLGRQLEKIQLDCIGAEGEIPDFGDLTDAWNECVNLRDLEFLNCSIGHAKSIMASPKEHLKNLYITPDCRLRKDEVKKVLAIFSEGTVVVETFNYTGPLLSGDSFDKFIARNRSLLSTLYFRFSKEILYEEMDTFLPRFLKCPVLEEVSAHGQTFSENMLKTLQSCGVRCQASF